MITILTSLCGQSALGDCRSSARRVIKFYQYQGTQTDEAKQVFSEFRKIVDDEVGTLNADPVLLGQHLSLETEPSASDAIYAPGQLNAPTTRAIFQYDHAKLLLLDGYLNLRTDNTDLHPIVHSDIYLALPGNAGLTPISEYYTIDVSQFQQASNIHVAATYYALAIDAQSRSCRPAQAAYLAKASEYLADIHSNDEAVVRLTSLIADAQHTLGH